MKRACLSHIISRTIPTRPSASFEKNTSLSARSRLIKLDRPSRSPSGRTSHKQGCRTTLLLADTTRATDSRTRATASRARATTKVTTSQGLATVLRAAVKAMISGSPTKVRTATATLHQAMAHHFRDRPGSGTRMKVDLVHHEISVTQTHRRFQNGSMQ